MKVILAAINVILLSAITVVSIFGLIAYRDATHNKIWYSEYQIEGTEELGCWEKSMTQEERDKEQHRIGYGWSSGYCHYTYDLVMDPDYPDYPDY